MRDRPLCSVCLMLAILICSVIYLGGDKAKDWLSPSQIEKNIASADRIQLKGKVYIKDQKEDYQILYLKNNSIYYQKQSFKESKIIIYDNTKQEISIGEVVQVTGKVRIFSPPRNPGNFNQKLYYAKSGIHGSVWATQLTVLATKKGERSRKDKFGEWLYRLRKNWKALLYEYAGEKNGAVLSAMILGEKADMDAYVKELYQRGGIGHVIAISGLHLSFVGVGIYQLFRKMTGSYILGGLAGITCLLLYVLMIGMTVSVVRAFVMFLFRVGADIAGRAYDSPTALSVAAVAALLWQPLSIYDGAFWLSFLAVLSLIVVAPLLEPENCGEKIIDGKYVKQKAMEQKFLQKREKFIKGILGTFCIQMVLLPIQLYFFYEIPLYSPLLNLIVIPLMSLLLMLGMSGSLIGIGIQRVSVSFPNFFTKIFTIILGIVFEICKWILWLYEQLCTWMLRIPGARLVIGKPAMWKIIAYYICFALFMLWRYREKKQKENRMFREKRITLHTSEASWNYTYKEEIRERPLRKCWGKWAVILVWCVSLFVLTHQFGTRDQLQVTVLDVGQGDCIFLRGPSGQTYLMDGGSTDTKNVGKYRIEPYLLSKGIKTLDYVFISHGDEDHISGILEMLERQEVGIHIETLVLPEQKVWDQHLNELAKQAITNGTRVVSMKEGQQLSEGDLKLLCLAPASEYQGESGNAASMVLAVAYRNFDMLLTGDVEGEGEELLTDSIKKNCAGRSFEVLKAAHHGSKNSSKEEFLQEVKPKLTIISAGIDNRYGHPHQETIERLEEAGSSVCSTQDYGGIEITVGRDVRVKGTLQ